MYAYQYYKGSTKPAAVLLIKDLKYRDEYISYYKAVLKGENPTLSGKFPLIGLPQYSPLYVIGYTKDSLLAEVVSYHDRGGYFGGNYLKGWVFAKALHYDAPSQSN